MSHKTIYLDSAATSFPKPPTVVDAVGKALRELGSVGRGAHSQSLAASREVFETRLALADFLSCPADRIVFTPGCTYSINFVLNGLGLTAGDAVVVSALQHNAVSRPLHQLATEHGVKVHRLAYVPGEIVDSKELAQTLERLKPKLCVLVEGSNVTGEMCDLATLAPICKKHGVPLLVDAAQTAGRQLAALNIEGISYWAASAHKAFFAPSGLGLLYVHKSADIHPSICGGTGSNSENLSMPTAYPDKLEPGTMPIHAIAGLHAGLEFILHSDPDNIRAHENKLANEFTNWCKTQPKIRLLSGLEHARQLPIVSFQLEGYSADRVADILDSQFGIAVRSGLHCAASAHEAIGTMQSGLVRASFGIFNTTGHVEVLVSAISNLSSK